MTQSWQEKEDRLLKAYVFDGFASAIGFMVEVALFCDKVDHHPEWKNVYNKVFVELTTHDTGGVSEKDRMLAAHMDKIFGAK